ncbi:hypothetical protein [Cupriavidus sp. UME77]|uniref:hypothetical protein n=1 Tax=Cupriavidus sp. UME77 TaxID=1862321 RepID=UPI0016012CC5|nr:hypothetical protein [Cupriavidus sp. UME77]
MLKRKEVLQNCRRLVLLVAALTAMTCASVARADDTVVPPTLEWGQVPEGDLYVLISSASHDSAELLALAREQIVPALAHNTVVAQIWSNTTAPVQFWHIIEAERMQREGVDIKQVLAALSTQLNTPAKEVRGIHLPQAWVLEGLAPAPYRDLAAATIEASGGGQISVAQLAHSQYMLHPPAWKERRILTLRICGVQGVDLQGLAFIVESGLTKLAGSLPEDVGVQLGFVGKEYGMSDGLFVMIEEAAR